MNRISDKFVRKIPSDENQKFLPAVLLSCAAEAALDKASLLLADRSHSLGFFLPLPAAVTSFPLTKGNLRCEGSL